MDKSEIEFITGGIAKDYRGQIRFVNDFDMSNVKRFYIINNTSTDVIRGWRGHRIETRWFYVLGGSFSIDVVKIDDWDKPSRNLNVETLTLEMSDDRVLRVPPGHATAFRAQLPNSELLVFADTLLEDAKNDDYTWATDYFTTSDD